jgi:hypothetical protein
MNAGWTPGAVIVSGRVHNRGIGIAALNGMW